MIIESTEDYIQEESNSRDRCLSQHRIHRGNNLPGVVYHKLNGGVTLFLGKLCVGERADCVITTLVFGAFKGGLISESFFLTWLKSSRVDDKPLP